MRALSLSRCIASRWTPLRTALRPLSLTALLDTPQSVPQLLSSVRRAASSAATEWELDLGALAERGAGCGGAAASHGDQQHHVLEGVQAVLAQVLAEPARTPIKTLRATVTTPHTSAVLARLIASTSLLSNVEVVELTVPSSVATVRQTAEREEEEAGDEGGSGQDVARLLSALLQQAPHAASWTRFSLISRDGIVFSHESSHAEESPPSAASVAVSAWAGSHSIWDDATVGVLARLLAARAWTHLALRHLDVSACSPSTRQLLWAALRGDGGRSCLRCLELTHMPHSREMIENGVLRHLPRLSELDVGGSQLHASGGDRNSEDSDEAVMALLRDVQAGMGGWWRLRRLGLAQCGIGDRAVALMAEQLRTRQPTLDGAEGGVADTDKAHRTETSAGSSCRTADTSTVTAVPCSNSSSGGATGGDGEDDGDVLLTSLDISGARLSRTAAFTLASCLVPCHQLTHVNARHCKLAAEGLEHLAAALQPATSLRSWVLCFNRFGDDGVAALARQAKYWPAMASLDLSRCRLTCRGVASLAAALPSWDRLAELRLVGNDLRCLPEPPSPSSSSTGNAGGSGGGTEVDGAGSGKAFFAYDPAYMKGHGSSMKVPTSFELDRRDRLEGRRRYRGTEEFRSEAEGAAAEERRGASLRRLTALEQLGEHLSLCSRLRLLDVSDCAMTDDGLRQFTQHYDGGAALTELRLAANPLFTTVAGLDALEAMLQRTQNLRHLDLSFTALGDLGVSMLCDGTSAVSEGALTAMSGLQTLNVASCGVRGLGWESLAAALPQCRSLRHVSLNYNTVEDARVLLAFMAELKAVPLLQSVNVLGCVVEQRAVRHVRESPECRALRDRGVAVHL